MPDSFVKMAESFKALGDPTRLKMLRLLAAHKEHSLCVGALAQRLGITQPAASQHLKVLKNVGLVEPCRKGFHVHYAINAEVLAAWKAQLDELCRFSSEQCVPSENCHKQ